MEFWSFLTKIGNFMTKKAIFWSILDQKSIKTKRIDKNLFKKVVLGIKCPVETK